MEGYDASIRNYLSVCFARGVTPRVAELAARFGLSPWAFTRRFQRAHGQPPGAVLRGAQIRQASRLLVETRAPMQSVAIERY